mmetsp:Transcript_18229/g.61935  ORF Transcript_18229/g.61935 Transcript_18229/m.61935 type:complete len:501 (+) Transcript_18229:688-2190(+)
MRVRARLGPDLRPRRGGLEHVGDVRHAGRQRAGERVAGVAGRVRAAVRLRVLPGAGGAAGVAALRAEVRRHGALRVRHQHALRAGAPRQAAALVPPQARGREPGRGAPCGAGPGRGLPEVPHPGDGGGGGHQGPGGVLQRAAVQQQRGGEAVPRGAQPGGGEGGGAAELQRRRAHPAHGDQQHHRGRGRQDRGHRRQGGGHRGEAVPAPHLGAAQHIRRGAAEGGREGGDGAERHQVGAARERLRLQAREQHPALGRRRAGGEEPVRRGDGQQDPRAGPRGLPRHHAQLHGRGRRRQRHEVHRLRERRRQPAHLRGAAPQGGVPGLRRQEGGGAHHCEQGGVVHAVDSHVPHLGRERELVAALQGDGRCAGVERPRHLHKVRGRDHPLAEHSRHRRAHGGHGAGGGVERAHPAGPGGERAEPPHLRCATGGVPPGDAAHGRGGLDTEQPSAAATAAPVTSTAGQPAAAGLRRRGADPHLRLVHRRGGGAEFRRSRPEVLQ